MLSSQFIDRLRKLAAPALLLLMVQMAQASPYAVNTNLQIRLVLNTTNSAGANSARIAKDPRNNQLYYLKLNGDVFQVNLRPGTNSTSTRLYNAADHGLATSVEGMAIGPDGTMYLTGNTTTNQGNSTFATVMKGVPDATGTRTWALLARTQPYPLSRTPFDHLMNGIVVSPDGEFVYVNSGARTDHGEVQSTGGLYPGLRDTALTAKILRLPAHGSDLILTNDLTSLRSAGYVFAEGTRNAFSLAFAPNGDLLATENGPDRDMADSLLWLQAGSHHGFPWRMGGMDNPQQFPNYNPTNDLLLDPRFFAVYYGYYHNDPTFPPPPTNFSQPVINVGPDACSYRDPSDGSIKIASQLGQTLSTVTAHRSPLGLVFDTAAAMAPPFQQHGFMLGLTQGDPTGNTVAGPFMDPCQDMLDVDLSRLGNTNYQARITRIVGGFVNPIDEVMISNQVYVVEYGGNQGIWEVAFPTAQPGILLSQPAWLPGSGFGFSLSTVAGRGYQVTASTDLLTWSLTSNVVAISNSLRFIDPSAINFTHRFYRVSSP
jgi:Glucose / Sorbosone dehydrogenase